MINGVCIMPSFPLPPLRFAYESLVMLRKLALSLFLVFLDQRDINTGIMVGEGRGWTSEEEEDSGGRTSEES